MMPRSRCRRRATRLLIAFVALLIPSLTAIAQEQSQYDRGTPPQHSAGISSLGSYISADIGTINLSNGSLNFKLPLGSVGGRGFWLPLTLNYSNKLWSGRRSQVFISDPAPGHMEPAAWAAYNDYTADIYYAVAPGWTVGAAPFLKVRGQGIHSINNPNGCTDFSWVLVKFTLTLPDRGEVEFRDDQLDGAPATAVTFGPTGCRTQDGYRGKRWHATDGSGTIFINDNDNGIVNGDLAGKVITADGTRYHFVNASSGNVAGSAYLNNIARCDWVRDRNGNIVNITYPTGSKVVYTDQLGRQTIVEFSVSDSQFPGETLALRVTLPGYNGSVRYYKVRSGMMSLNYRSDDNPVLPVYNGAYPTGVIGTELFATSYEAGMERIDDKQVLTQLVLPDSRAVTFKYNRFGEVAEVQPPTGGRVQYDYLSVPLDTVSGNGLPSGNSLPPEVIASGQQAGGNVKAVDRAVVARRTYPDGSTLEGTWSYSYKITKTEVKCTSGGITLLDEWHYFLAAQRFLTGSTSTGADGTGYSLWSTGVERRSEMVDTNGTTVLSAAEQDWIQRASVSWSTGYTVEQVANDNRVTEQRKYLDDGSMAKTDTFYDATIAASNHINNPSDVYEYDFDQTLKRRSTTSYIIGTPYTSTGVNTVNILSLPVQQSVYDGGGAELARATYEYDNYTADGNHAALQSYTPDAYNHDSGYGFSYTTRGNATQITRMVNGSTFTYTYPRYDTLGNVVSTKDPRTNITTISYQDDFGNGAGPGFGGSGSFGPTYSLPTLITSPPPNPSEPQQTARSQYDFSTGLLTGFKDRNGTITQTLYNDLFDRPTQIKSALFTPLENHTALYYAGLNPVTVFGVTLTNNDVLTAKDQSGMDDGNLRSWTKTDGFGRTLDSFARDPQGDVRTTATYDGLGRAKRITNPYRTTSDPTYGYTDTTFDLLGRVTRVETFSGSGASTGAVTTAYSGNQVTVTDQALKMRRSVTDGLGRLKQVIEDPNVLAYSTTYSYDALDDLTSVTQGVQSRTFSYDGLKRLTQAINPESGTINYTYDPNSNLETKQDARLITTTYAYDALNRVKSRTYTNDPQSTPAVSYKYDAQALQAGSPPSFDRGSSIGRLVAVTYGGVSSGTYRGYDQLGRVVRQVQQTDGIDYAVDATYDLAGEAKTETYPAVPGFADRRTVSFSYDTAGRTNSISSAATSYAAAANVSSMTYSAHGGLASETYGSGLVHAMTYNPRLQPDHIKLGTAGAPTSILDIEYTYSDTNPNIHDNNGNVRTQKVTAGAFFLTQTYTYDQLNRLGSASEKVGSETNPRWTQSYGYDRFGNRTSLANTGEIPPQTAPGVDPATNRLLGFPYDAAGNLAQSNFVNRYYDAENRMVLIGNSGPTRSTYLYDGEGRRVFKHLPGPQSGSNVYYVYDVAGMLVADYTYGPFSSSSQEYVYGASGLVATIQPGIGTTYLTADHLGSPRVATNNSQAVVSRHDYLSFGEELSAGIGGRTAGMGYGGIDGVRQKFTQKERDNESGLDYFGERYYSSAQGRFTTVDPLGASAQRTNPQTMNRYGYALNNPLRFVDPDGMDSWDTLTKKEQDLIAPKLKLEEGQTARDAFNQLVKGGDEKATNTNTLSIQNFIDQVGGSAAWQQIQTVTGVEHNTPNQETNQEQSSNIKMTIADNAKFLDALGKGGYDVNGIGDTGRKAGQLVWRNLGNVLGAVINSTPIIITSLPNHPFDNARASTPGHNDPQLHFYNEYGGNTFYAHWDATSSNARKDGPIGNIAGGAGHGASASPQTVRRYLKDIGKTPQ